jgi:RNA polymerase sigma factor (sigma-70 family)
MTYMAQSALAPEIFREYSSRVVVTSRSPRREVTVTNADTLVTAHLYLVDEAVARYRHRCRRHELDDVRSDAQLALVEAARQFREDGGAKFTTFARAKIDHAVIDGHRRRDHLSRAHRAKVGSGQFQSRSLDAMEGGDHLLSVSGDLGDVDNRELLARLMRDLDEPQRQAVTLRHLDGLSIAAAARQMKLKYQEVQYLLRTAMAHMRRLAGGGEYSTI